MAGELTRQDLEAALHDAVEAALEAERQESQRRRAAEDFDEDEREQLARRLKRVQAWAGAAVACVTFASGGAAWVYARGQRDQAAAAHELQQDATIETTKAALKEHVEAEGAARREQSTTLRNMGALTIEQGNDQRTILLKSAPKSVREELEDKPPALVEAEGLVLRAPTP
jgi:high-affinity Fe2+/Pb2+ permease